jgi:hypothetical protein
LVPFPLLRRFQREATGAGHPASSEILDRRTAWTFTPASKTPIPPELVSRRSSNRPSDPRRYRESREKKKDLAHVTNFIAVTGLRLPRLDMPCHCQRTRSVMRM